MIFYDFPIYDNVRELPLYLINMGLQHCQDHIIRKSGYPSYQILYCNNGSGTLIFDGNEYLINSKTAFFLPPDYPHEYYANEDIWDIHWVVFDGIDNAYTIPLILINVSMDKPSVIKLYDTNRLDLLFLSMHEAICSDKLYGTLKASGILYSFLLEFNRLVKDKSYGAHYNPSLLKAVEYINSHYNEQISLQQLCDMTKITKQHMCLLFRTSLNARPMEYLSKKRLQEAKLLLATTDKTIEEIAAETGFNSTSYFCKQFRIYEKTTPGQFRNNSFL